LWIKRCVGRDEKLDEIPGSDAGVFGAAKSASADESY
jgi:hypothetical protein